MEDLQSASKLLVKALQIRQRYMGLSRQYFPSVVERFMENLDKDKGKGKPKYEGKHKHMKRATLEGIFY